MKPRLLDLPHGHRAMIDEADWWVVRGLTLYRGSNGYVYFSEWRNGRSQPQTLHGFLLKPPKGTHVDHINGDKFDNRRENLRIVTPSRNQVNRKRLNKNNTSGVRGVHKSKYGTWIAQITYAGGHHYLGSFATRSEAVEARRSGELCFFGELCP